MSNEIEDRLTRLEAAVSTGLNISLAEFDTPDQADARAKEAEKAAEAEAKLVEANRQAAADKEIADAKAATDLSLAKSSDLEAQQQAERDANAKAAQDATSGPPITFGAPAAPTSVDPAHADAVAAVADATAAVPAAPAKDRAALLAKAQADVNTALATWPDSAELQDAKAQLEAMKAAS